jgi:hypothetical protein
MTKTLGGVQGGYRDGGEQRGDPTQQRFDRARCREVQENPVLVLLDVRRHFEQREDHGAGLGRGEGRLGEGMRAQGMVEDLGGAGKQKPRGVGQERRVGGAVTVEITLDRFDIVFAIPPCAVEVFIHVLGCRLL